MESPTARSASYSAPSSGPRCCRPKTSLFPNVPLSTFFFFWLSKLQYGFGSSPPKGFV